MNYAALRNEILRGPKAPECAPLVLDGPGPHFIDAEKINGTQAAERDQAIADILNAPVATRAVSRFVSHIDLMAQLGPLVGASILDKLEGIKASSPPIKWAMLALTSARGIDVGHYQTRAILDQLIPPLTQEEVAAIKALAEQPYSLAHLAFGRPVTASDVSIALRGNADFQPE